MFYLIQLTPNSKITLARHRSYRNALQAAFVRGLRDYTIEWRAG